MKHCFASFFSRRENVARVVVLALSSTDFPISSPEVTVFSASNYGGVLQNHGAVLVYRDDTFPAYTVPLTKLDKISKINIYC